jgi:Flp pilus assembly protein TadG
MFIVLMFGAIDGGLLIGSRCMVSYAAIVGARVASARATDTGSTPLTTVRTAAKNAAPFLSLTDSNIAVSINGASAVGADAAFVTQQAPGKTVRVTVTYTYTPYTRMLGFFTTKTLTGVSQVVME